MGALEPAALLRSQRPDFTDPADLERYLSTVRKEDLPAVSASLSAQADQAEAACWEQINWGWRNSPSSGRLEVEGPMTGARLPDQNNEQRLYLVARVLPTPHLGGVTADFDWDRVDLGAAGGDLAELPRRYGEGHWADRITDAIRRINDGDLSGVDYLLRAFGGMGSLNDLLIHEANGHSIAAVEVGPVNDRLDELRTRVYSAASRIRRSSDRPG